MEELYFLKYQNLLVNFANTEAGRFLLGVKNNFPIIKLSPNSIHFSEGIGSDRYYADFYTFSKIANVLLPALSKVEIANEYKKVTNINEALLHYTDIKKYDYPTIYLTLNSFTSFSGCDGNIWNGNANFATAVALTTGNASLSSTSEVTRVWNSSGTYYIDRNFFSFLTSSIGSDKTILQSSFYLFADTIQWSGGGIALVQSTASSGNTLVSGDFDNLGTTEGYTRVVYTTTGQKEFVLNATGISWVSKTGYTKLATRYSNDIDGTYITDGGVVWRMSEYGGFDPRLTVFYNTNTNGVGNKFKSISVGNGMSRSEGAT